MRLLIHIGLHKTGTSTVQMALDGHRSVLREESILLPASMDARRVDLAKSGSVAGHRRFRALVEETDIERFSRKLKPLASEIASARPSTLILTDETLSAPGVRVSRHAARWMLGAFDTVDVYAYVRDHSDWADSFYREFISWQNIRCSQGPDEFWLDRSRWLLFASRLRPWLDALGPDRVHLRRYIKGETEIVSDFWAWTGLQDLCARPEADVPQMNPSIPWRDVPAMLAINELNISSFEKASMLNDLESVDLPLREVALPVKLEKSVKQDLAELSDLGLDLEIPRFLDQTAFEQRLAAAKERLVGRGDSQPDRTLKPTKNSGTWALSCLTNGSRDQVAFFAAYHRRVGAHSIRIYLDDSVGWYETDPLQLDGVEFIRISSQYWIDLTGTEVPDLDTKLEIIHLDARAAFVESGVIDFTITLDGDELLWLDDLRFDSISAFLESASEDASQIVVRSYEAVFLNGEAEKLFGNRYFKVPSHGARSGLALRIPPGIAAPLREQSSHSLYLRLRERIVSNFGDTRIGPLLRSFEERAKDAVRAVRATRDPESRFYRDLVVPRAPSSVDMTKRNARFLSGRKPYVRHLYRGSYLGHSEGRLFSERSVRIDSYSSHRQWSESQIVQVLHDQASILLLHFDAVSGADWIEKMEARTTGQTISLMMGHERGLQVEVLDDAQTHDARMQIFEDLHCYSMEEVQDLVAYGVLRRIDTSGVLDAIRNEHTASDCTGADTGGGSRRDQTAFGSQRARRPEPEASIRHTN